MQWFFHMPRVAKAFSWAVRAHRDQKYGDLPYFTHILDVAERVPFPSENELVAAMLHDIVEDTDVTVDNVVSAYGQDVGKMVALVTKDKYLNYEKNISRIIESGNVGAMKVKWADNLANMSSDKHNLTPAARNGLTRRWTESYLRLSHALGV